VPESTAYAYEGGMGYPNTLEVGDTYTYPELCMTSLDLTCVLIPPYT
jgi:hypothetical protein